MIKKGPHSTIPPRKSKPDAPDVGFTNHGNKTTLPIDRVLEREQDMREIRDSQASGTRFSGLEWSNIVTFAQGA